MKKNSHNIDELLELASKGCADAQCDLGEYFEAKDNAKAVFWYEKAAAQDYITAMYALAYMYEYGLGVKIDYAKSLSLYQRCARQIENGDSVLAFTACRDIAGYYEEGKSVPVDLPTAVSWYEKADRGGVLNKEDYLKLARFYETQGGISYAKAAYWYKRAANYKALLTLYEGPLCDAGKAQYYAAKLLQEKFGIGDDSLTLRHATHTNLNYSAVLDDFKQYYANIFRTDFNHYYDIAFCEERKVFYTVICSAQSQRDYTPDNYYFFALSTYFHSLFAQVLGEMVGKDAMHDYFRSSGLPMMNCTNGGMLHPIQVILESDLCPYAPETDDFLFVLAQVKAFIISDFMDFLKGEHSPSSDEPYARLVAAAKPHLWNIENECVVQSHLFRMWLNDPSFHFNNILIR